MELRYGGYSFGVNAAVPLTRRVAVLNDAGVAYQEDVTVTVRFVLLGAGQSAITQAVSALRTACARPYQDLVLYQDSGAASADVLRNAGASVGVRCIRGPDFEKETGAEYATERTGTVVFQASYPLVPGNGLISFEETVSVSGGEPLYRMLPSLDGLPQRQMVFRFTPCRATQRGRAVGFLAYPTPPPPLWPADLAEPPEVVRASPERKAGPTPTYRNYLVEWSYTFEAALPLVGTPNLWP